MVFKETARESLTSHYFPEALLTPDATLAHESQKWHLKKSAFDDGFKIDLRPVLTKFGANLSFPGLIKRLAGL